jgi:hypothetical protein
MLQVQEYCGVGTARARLDVEFVDAVGFGALPGISGRCGRTCLVVFKVEVADTAPYIRLRTKETCMGYV